MLRRNVIASLLLAALACGGASETDIRTQNGPTDFAGSSARFSLYDVWVLGAADPSTQPFNQLGLEILDYPAACLTPDAGTLAGRHAGLFLSITALKTEPLAPRTYVVGVGSNGGLPWVGGEYLPFESACSGPDVHASSGTIDLSRLDDTSAAGTVDVTLHDGTRLQGDFVATQCPPPPGFSPLPDGGVPEPQPFCQ